MITGRGLRVSDIRWEFVLAGRTLDWEMVQMRHTPTNRLIGHPLPYNTFCRNCPINGGRYRDTHDFTERLLKLSKYGWDLFHLEEVLTNGQD